MRPYRMGARQNDIPMADFWAVTGTFRMRRDSSGWAGMAGVRENKCRYMIQRFLSVADADRALRGFRKHARMTFGIGRGGVPLRFTSCVTAARTPFAH